MCDVGVNGSGCIYKIYIHSNVLTSSETQSISLIVTTSGIVSGPTEIPFDEVFTVDDQIGLTQRPHPDVIDEFTGFEVSLDISGELSHEQNISTVQVIDQTGFLESIDAILLFDIDESGHNGEGYSLLNAAVLNPASLELTIVDPEGRAVAVGGADSSLGIADITTEW